MKLKSKQEIKMIGEIIWRYERKRHYELFPMWDCLTPKFNDGYFYLECDGDKFNPIDYPDLYALLGGDRTPVISSINCAVPYIRAQRITKK
jgi:hypothetical protein